MVWAAAFALELKETWKSRSKFGTKIEYDENDFPTYVSSACENASYAVWCARSALGPVVEGFGESDDVTNELRGILGKDPK